MTAPDLNDRRWRTFRKGLIDTLPPICGICGKHVDTSLPGTHPRGPQIDHIVPRNKGGARYDKSNCQLAHLSCNASKQDTEPPPQHSRSW